MRDVDVVLDTQGGKAQQRSWQVLKKGGVLVSVVQPPSEEEATKHSVRSAMFVRQPNAGELSEISELIDSEKVQVVVETHNQAHTEALCRSREKARIGEHRHHLGN